MAVRLISALKRALPWWSKIAIKIVLSRLPISYRVWKRLSLFEHGDMESPEYVVTVFNDRKADAGISGSLEGKTCLELGPGDSIASALIAKAHGAERIYLVDAGDFATRELEIYNRIAGHLAELGLEVAPAGGFTSFEQLLDHCSVTYLTRGVTSLRSLPSESVDYIWSNAVLEHVRRFDFADVMHEFRRITKPDGIGSHGVDLSDHLGGALNNLCFSEPVWESPLFANSGFYTNRIQYTPMLDICRDAGFETDVVSVETWDAVPTPCERLVEPFRSHPADDLRVREFNVVLRPRPSR